MKYVVGSKEVTLVDANDTVLGKMDIFKAHRQPCYLHRASSVWLFRQHQGQTQVLLQQRSQYKPIGAGWWGNAVCANVRPDETYLQCAIRRLQGEIGVTSVEIKPLFQFEYKAYGNQEFSEHEYDQVFVGKCDILPIPNPDEVSQVKWVNWQDLQNYINSITYVDHPQSLTMSYQELEEKAPPVTYKVKGSDETILIAPWTAMMIRDVRLHDLR